LSVPYSYTIKPNKKAIVSIEIPDELKGKRGTFSFKEKSPNSGFVAIDNIEFTNTSKGTVPQNINQDNETVVRLL
jgi:hypothetical protein